MDKEGPAAGGKHRAGFKRVEGRQAFKRKRWEKKKMGLENKKEKKLYERLARVKEFCEITLNISNFC